MRSGGLNQEHTVEAMLEEHGYTRRGNRWMSPTSSSGLAGVVVLDGRAYSHHASDPLADGHTHDAFDMYRVLAHGGDMRGAIRAAAKALGLDPTGANGETAWPEVPPIEAYKDDSGEEWAGDQGADEHEARPGPGAEAPAGPRVLIARGDDLNIKPIKWAWDGYLARGKLHVLAGAPGAGKSTIALALAAVVTTGGKWPDGTRCAQGHVLVWSDEDDPEDTLLPRFLAAGGDPKRFHVVRGTADHDGVRRFDPATDIPLLLAEARKIPDCLLAIVDPVVSVVQGDSHKNTEVRRALQPLVGFAEDLSTAVLGISHFTKGTAGRDPVERVTGSLAFGALPRVVMAAAKGKDDTEPRVFCRAKSNIGPDGGGWNYQLVLSDVPGVDGMSVVRAQWGGELEGTARELLGDAEVSGDPDVAEAKQEERSAVKSAEEWLRELLKDGPVNVEEVQENAKAARVGSWRTVERAKARLGAKSIRPVFGGPYRWALPEHCTPLQFWG